MTNSIGASVASILGGGNTIDTSSLVSQLVNAARAPRQNAITDSLTLNSTRISALASATSSLDTFVKALSDTLKSSNYSGQPASNDTSIASLSSLPGGTPQGLPAQIEVRQLAAAQVLESQIFTAATSPVGLGTMTLTTASGSHTITIDNTNNSLTGLAAAINGANAGVTASVVTDNRGARLILKGGTGAANAFTLTKGATDTADAQLATFSWDGAAGGMARDQQAADSVVYIDGIRHQNNSNTLDNALPYVRIDLNKAVPGTLVTLATNQPAASMKDLVQEFVTAYNTLRTALNNATAGKTSTQSAGALAGDSGVRDMMNKLTALSTTTLSSSGTYHTLSDIGVRTNQNGTLTLDGAAFDKAFAADPTGIAQMLNPTVSSASNPGLAKVATDLQTSLENSSGSLAGSKSKYDKLATEYQKQLDNLNNDMSDYQDQLNTVYTAMNAKLSALRATQSYLDQQISIWSGKNND